MLKRFFSLIFILSNIASFAQITIGGGLNDIDYTKPLDYEIGGISISGTDNLDPNALVLLSGLSIGEKIKIPGDKIGNAIKNLWAQNLFSDITISIKEFKGNVVFLDIEVEERERMSRFKFQGVRKSEADNLREKIELYKERIVTDNLLISTQNKVEEYFIDKGFLNVDVKINVVADSIFPGKVMLNIVVDKKKKIKVNQFIIEGNTEFSNAKIKRNFKETKQKSLFKPFEDFDGMLKAFLPKFLLLKTREAIDTAANYFSERIVIRIFKSSKYLEENFEKDKAGLMAKYNSKGYRDAKIIADSISKFDDKSINVHVSLYEGNQYYFRHIKFTGNTKYPTETLNNIINIKKGDIYDPGVLDQRLFMDPNGKDISSLYMDDGYLFFQVSPMEVRVDNDSIDLEIIIYEGQQATINRVSVIGNTKTNDHVIMREIRTKPGQLFSRADIIRSQRELSTLGYFDAEQLNVTPQPNPQDGTVDIVYTVAEAPNDQLQLSGGWGAGRVLGTVGVSFNNFSTRNFFKKGEWTPLPSGDGQRIMLSAQSNGWGFQSYNISFTEPWLGGKKPNSLTLSAFHSVLSNGQRKFIKDSVDTDGSKVINPMRAYNKMTGFSIGLGRRLRWPDDYFILRQDISIQQYEMKDWSQFIFSNGISNNLFYRFVLSRSSIDQIIYPRLGSEISLSLQATPPFSLFNDLDYRTASAQDRYRWVEYHKWKFTSAWYTTLVSNLVLYTKVGFGFLGKYNNEVGPAPFERFYLGGSGLTGFALDGREIIALRGYDDQSVSPQTGGTIISKYTTELRFPFVLSPQSTIYALSFVEAGNTWANIDNYNPFAVNRSAGLGIRIFLPMFGLLGLDWGYRFNEIPGREGMQRSQIHFTIGANLGEL